jgi:ubiquinone/menaquinone biosynthesis C-methylase UbiE
MMRTSQNYQSIFKEVRRVLKPGRRLAIIECHKTEAGFGLNTGRLPTFKMNKVCAAGTGLFLEEQEKKYNILFQKS